MIIKLIKTKKNIMMSSKNLLMVIFMTRTIIFFMSENVQMCTAFLTCEGKLKAFGFNGQSDHDTQYFEIPGQFDHDFPYLDVPQIPIYRAFILHIEDKILFTKDDLVIAYCLYVELLFSKGITGVLPIDRFLTENKDNNDEVNEYIKFINGEPYSGYKDKQSQFVFDLIYEFVAQKKIATDGCIECKKALVNVNYNGNFLHDVSLLRQRKTKIPSDSQLETKDIINIQRYNIFLEQTKSIVLFTNRNIMNVYCDLLGSLIDQGFMGEFQTDYNHARTFIGNNMPQQARIYSRYLDLVKTRDVYAAVELKLPESYLIQLGLYKMGKIMF